MTAKLELYRIFREVARWGSISEAAKQLYISQSAVSQSVRQLEEQLETPLFRRTGKGVLLTREGELLLGYAASAVDLLAAGEEKLAAVRSLTDGTLEIAASDTISRYLLLSRLERFHSRYPGIKLRIVNRTSPESAALLKSGRVDLAFINLPFEDEELSIDRFLEVQDVFVASPHQSQWLEQVFSLEEIARLPLILLESKSNSRRYVEAFFRQKGLSLEPEIELGSHDLLLEFARIRLGVSCVIREFSRQYLDSGELMELRLAESIPARHIGIASLKGVALSSAARRFLESE